MASRSSAAPPAGSKLASSSSSSALRAGTGAPVAATTIKVRAGGSGQSSLALKQAAAAPTNGRMPTATAGPVASPAKPASHRIVIAARPAAGAGVGNSAPAAATPSKAAPTKPAYEASAAAAPVTPVRAPTVDSSSSSSHASSTNSTVSPSRAPASSYVNPTSYLYPTGPESACTPNGINLDLSGSRAPPQLLAIASRSDRLRSACLSEDKLEVVNLLGQGTDPNQTDAYGNTALMLAASTGNEDVVEELLAHGASVHAKDKYGQTPLIFACSKGHFAVAKMLVEKKAGVNVTTMHGQTALMKVCYLTHPHSGILAELLLTHKARPDLQTADGSSAGSIAAQNDHMELLEILHHHAFNVDVRKADGNSLLHLAAEKASFTMVANLVAMGAKQDVKNNEGRTFLQMVPLARPGAPAAMPMAEFTRKLGKAVDRGLALREERAEEERSNAELRAALALKKVEAQRALLVAERVAEGLSPLAAQQAADAALTEAGEHPLERSFFVDEEGVEHYSRPSSARLTEEEMRARTYKPKIDPTSVFGDAPAADYSTQPPQAESFETSSFDADMAAVRDELADGDSADENEPTEY